MKDNWTKQMKSKLDGHKMTPPAGLWEGISNQMNLEPTPAPKPTIIRKWHWAVAAVVLALVGFFAFYDFDDAEPKLEAKSEVGIKSAPAKQDADNEPTISEEAPVPEKPLTSAKPIILAAKPTLLTQAEIQQTTIEETNNQEEVVEELKSELKTEAQQTKRTNLPDVTEAAATASSSESKSKWTIGLSGSNGLLLANNNVNSNTDYLYYSADPIGVKDNYTSSTPIYTIAKTDVKHNIPLRLGLSLQYQLDNRLALLSGISYTYLKSEYNITLYNLSYDQELSYLGIPIGLSWKIWSTKHFNVYLAGGTLIEKCIKAEVSEDEIKTKPWQWSVNASAGAEYYFTRQFGVYLEPSLGYYFDDGTNLEHYYKEHPLAPSVQFGLRLHLK